jgi:hypothetical protein
LLRCSWQQGQRTPDDFWKKQRKAFKRELEVDQSLTHATRRARIEGRARNLSLSTSQPMARHANTEDGRR